MRNSGSRRIVILSGGAGTRLWPLSRELNPKQFFGFSGAGKPLLVETLDRLKGFGPASVVTTEALRFSTIGLAKRYGLEAEVVGEPTARNTAAAVALGCKRALASDPKSVLGVFPADHLIAKPEAFAECLEAAFREAESGAVVTLGIRPSYPATGYGYMELDGEAVSGKVAGVRRFIEKPGFEAAERMLETGRYVWNAGMFIFPAALMADHFRKHMPELWALIDGLKPDLSNLKEIYPKLPSQSVDYGIMEKISGVRCVPADMGWSDIGSWEEVAKLGKTLGDPIQVEGGSNFYTGFVPRGKRATFVGVSDLVVVDTPDALLVTRKGWGQSVRNVVEVLKKDAPQLVKAHTYEERPWGRFEILMDTEHFKSKRISVWPGQKLSYQSHAKREENWTIVRGEAEVTLDGVVHKLKPGAHIHIPLGAKHRIANPGREVMEFIEVQTGTYFGEDDIVRYSDDYGRA
jgi:mannose-1-phosphate guanylyltransferase/mannose-1-phosphate guanylyltransferase/mannose-6-phosphate isomerase